MHCIRRKLFFYEQESSAFASISIGGGTFSIATADDGFHTDDTLSISLGMSLIYIEGY
jgi:hypothetical protein